MFYKTLHHYRNRTGAQGSPWRGGVCHGRGLRDEEGLREGRRGRVGGGGGALAGCGQGASDTSTEKRKVLRFGQANSKQGLDMQKSTSSQSSSISDTIFETPLLFTEDNELVPLLFTEVPAPEADGVT